jgi:hypothetical protein
MGAWGIVQDAGAGGQLIYTISAWPVDGLYNLYGGLNSVLEFKRNATATPCGFGGPILGSSTNAGANPAYAVSLMNYTARPQDVEDLVLLGGEIDQALPKFVENAGVNMNALCGFTTYLEQSTTAFANGLVAENPLVTTAPTMYDFEDIRTPQIVVVQSDDLPCVGYLGQNGGQAPIISIVPYPVMRSSQAEGGQLQGGYNNYIKLRNPEKLYLNKLTIKLTDGKNKELEGLTNTSHIWLKFRHTGELGM